MGQDNLQGFSKWKNHEEILRHCSIYVYPRPGSTVTEFDTHPKVNLTQAPVIAISSTFIREGLRQKKDMRYFLPSKVWQELEASSAYR